MEQYNKLKFGIKIDKNPEDMWSFCVGLSHFRDETYLYINLFRRAIAIGYMYEDLSYDDDEWMKTMD